MMWGLSEEAGVLHAGAQPNAAISLLMAKLVRYSAPYSFPILSIQHVLEM